MSADGFLNDLELFMARELSEAEAKALAVTWWWEHMTAKQAALLQLKQPLLCMPNRGVLCDLLTVALGREVEEPEMNWISPEQFIAELES